MRLTLTAMASACAIAGCSGSVGTLALPPSDGGSTSSATSGSSSSSSASTTSVSTSSASDPPPDACVPRCPPGANCGIASDGCGGKRQCGVCSGYDTCGGGGAANVCGCTPVACVVGQTCGTVPDNCGGMETCNDCPATALCENSACLSLQTYGCTRLPTASCAGGAPAGMACVLLISYYPTTSYVAAYACPAATALPSPSCVPNVSGYDCAAGDPAH